MKVLTWNINGIRASKRSVKDVIDLLDADIICLQETKITRDMLDEPTAVVEGYNAYFSFSRKRSGYSGVANFCKDATTPIGAEEGLSGMLTNHSEGRVGGYGNTTEFGSEELQSLDGEGRAVMTRHQIQLGEGDIKDLTLINVYVPRAAANDDRWTFKQRFLALLQCRAEALLREGSHVIILGDINTTHKKIDHCDPTTQEFLRIDSRQWINQLLREEDRDPEILPIEDRSSHEALTAHAEGGHFMDTFRFFHPDRTEAYTNWSTVTSARETNYGKRLDYIFVDTGLKDYLVDCDIMPDFEGSDHCPVVLELRCTPVPSKTCPPICTRFMPEFQGKQQKLLSFFTRKSGAKSGPKGEGSENESEKTSITVKDDEDSEQSGSSQSSISSTPTLPTLNVPVPQGENRTIPKTAEPQKGSLKRLGPDKLTDASSKKKKKGNGSESKNTLGKQSSLLGFFKKPAASADSTAEKQNPPEEAESRYWQQSTSRSTGDGTEQNGSEQASVSSPEKAKIASSPEKSFTSASLASLQCIADKSDAASSGDSSQNADICEGTNSAVQPSKPKASSLWKGLLSGPPPPPPCKGHREPCVLRTVKKQGPNKGKQFYVCARPEGSSTNKEARCDHFQWVTHMPSGNKKVT